MLTHTTREVPTIGNPFYLTVVDDSTSHTIPRSRTIYRTNATDAMAEAISESKTYNRRSQVYYCVPVGEADAAHSHLRSMLEVLGQAALGLEEGGYDSAEGTALTG